MAVKLRLTRGSGRACAYYSGRLERFRRTRCGRAPWLKVGDAATWSYLLPQRLARGRYLLEVQAIDRALNRGTPTRVRFRVR